MLKNRHILIRLKDGSTLYIGCLTLKCIATAAAIRMTTPKLAININMLFDQLISQM